MDQIFVDKVSADEMFVDQCLSFRLARLLELKLTYKAIGQHLPSSRLQSNLCICLVLRFIMRSYDDLMLTNSEYMIAFVRILETISQRIMEGVGFWILYQALFLGLALASALFSFPLFIPFIHSCTTRRELRTNERAILFTAVLFCSYMQIWRRNLRIFIAMNSPTPNLKNQ